jgi:hypothetical protein
MYIFIVVLFNFELLNVLRLGWVPHLSTLFTAPTEVTFSLIYIYLNIKVWISRRNSYGSIPTLIIWIYPEFSVEIVVMLELRQKDQT